MTVDLFVQPIQILVGMALVIYTLGYSALVGMAVRLPNQFHVSKANCAGFMLCWTNTGFHVRPDGPVSSTSIDPYRRPSQTSYRSHRRYPVDQAIRTYGDLWGEGEEAARG